VVFPYIFGMIFLVGMENSITKLGCDKTENKKKIY